MTWDIYRPAVAGEITDAEWMRLIAMRLPLPEPDAAAAVAEWQQHRGDVDQEVLALRPRGARGRAAGRAGHQRHRPARGDLAALGLAGEFDVVVSSWELKIHKPAPEFFAAACAALGQDPQWVLFVDDDDRAIRGARAAEAARVPVDRAARVQLPAARLLASEATG